MDSSFSKSQSPLYLIAACEALRKFGIFEKVTQYIESLPNTITELFSFLLDEWSINYGKLFVEDVAGLLCASKDGLLENQINGLLHFKEQREKSDGEFLYDANFPRIYDSIAKFLAAGMYFSDKQTDGQTEIRTDGQTERRTDRQTEKHTDKQTDRQAGICYCVNLSFRGRWLPSILPRPAQICRSPKIHDRII